MPAARSLDNICRVGTLSEDEFWSLTNDGTCYNFTVTDAITIRDGVTNTVSSRLLKCTSRHGGRRVRARSFEHFGADGVSARSALPLASSASAARAAAAANCAGRARRRRRVGHFLVGPHRQPRRRASSFPSARPEPHSHATARRAAARTHCFFSLSLASAQCTVLVYQLHLHCNLHNTVLYNGLIALLASRAVLVSG